MLGFVGAVVEPIDDERSSLFGACFAIERQHFVTADHVLEAAQERGAEQLHIVGSGMAPAPVVATFRHPSADIAVLHVEHDAAIRWFSMVGAPEAGETVQMFAPATREHAIATVTGHGRRLSTTSTADPDTGGQGRDGRIAEVTYTPALDQATVAIDSTRTNVEALLARLAVVVGQGQ